ncbi:hypothetical protein J1C56_16100 [Aminobacter anthyllidis]|uniref:Uncharacterized protein n=1 Tax=Aminobacter anthyllidis TaxID=1035067 RepID=A0A9X1AC17_9HYPH|nr:hypothetical protein [Aminobacter anthyllidis]MBT1157119.1 hypothetical protein [Aminobacter anthyllidis]
MAFRADEAAAAGYEKAKNYLISRHFEPATRIRSERALEEIIAEIGPAVESYPTWHPLVMRQDRQHPEMWPSERCGYAGLDHTCYFAHGFITCPYVDGQAVIDSVEKLGFHAAASITAERLNVPFYSEGATPILVRCEWTKRIEPNHLIPKHVAVPLMIEQELPCWTWAERAETWDTMRAYLLGQPHGNRSSLFVSQDTALALKKMYLSMVESGMFGPSK